MKISSKYNPLFNLLKNKHKGVDTVIVTGGRYSSKSWGVGLLCSEAFIQYDWKILYTRFTNTSVEDSIVAEFKSKLEINNYNKYCEVIKARVKSTCGDGEIVFKGIKTGSKTQTAALKSLSGFNCFVVDEAEEIPDFKTFEKVYFSIRSTTKRNISILILNPTLKSHWVHQKYFKDKVPDGFNGIKDNVLYIHTSYLDVEREFIPDNIYNSFELMKQQDPVNYKNIVLGGWVDKLEGTVFKRLNTYDSIRMDDVEMKVSCIDVADQGDDYLCQIVGYVIGNIIFIEDVIMDKSDSSITQPRVVDFIKKHDAEFNWIESNNAGNTFTNFVLSDCPNSNIIPFNSSGNKMTRIISNEWLVTRHFRFKAEYDYDSDYGIFMSNLMSFNKDIKLNVNDDAPDCVASLARLLYGNFPYLFNNDTDF